MEDHPPLAAHAAHLTALAVGFRRYLLPEGLTFIPPPVEHDAHPKSLLAKVIARADRERGVLLTGPSGAGKTRTLIEVARRADAAGWRVLHGEPALADDDLARGILQGTGRTLVLCDDFEQMRIDVGALRRRILPEARKRGIRLAMLASARTARAIMKDPEREAFFEAVEVPSDERHARAVLAEMRRRVAPRAVEILGTARVDEITGKRPILALVILRELERRAEMDLLGEHEIGGVQPGELLDWLRSRLHEDELVVRPADPALGLTAVESKVIAAAAVLGAAPQREEHLRGVAMAALRAARHDALTPLERERFAVDIVAGLRELGWLDARTADLAAAHDGIVDEVLTQVLRVPARDELRAPVLESVLEPCKHSARTLKRLAVALQRLLGEQAGRFERALAEGAERWFGGAAAPLSKMLTDTDPDEASYALGAMLEGGPWAGAVERSWGTVVVPWLLQCGELPAARHLLYRGLRIEGEAGRQSIGPALRWAAKNGARSNGSFVLTQLLGRTDLDRDASKATVDHALSWIEAHGRWLEAQFVFHALLGRADLDRGSSKAAVGHALSWLSAHGTSLEAHFVLHRLLGRADLDGGVSEAAVDHALSWLEAHGTSPEAYFVLHSLLGRADVDRGRAEAAVDHALSWLGAHGESPEAQFVFHALLKRADLDRGGAQAAVDHALSWLSAHGASPAASYVLHSLLKRTDLDKDGSEAAVDHALSWLSAHGTSSSADFVLRSLLGRADLNRDASEAAVDHALSWLSAHGTASGADFVLRSLLGRKDLAPATESAAIQAALAWTEANPHHPNLDFVLNRLLRSRATQPDIATRAASLAVAWLQRAPATRDRDHTLNSLLRRAELLDDTALRIVVDDARAWIGSHRPPMAVVMMLISYLRPVALRAGRAREIEALRRAHADPSSASPSGPASSFRDLTTEIASRAQATGTPADPRFVRAALAATRRKVERGAVVATGFALPGLLPLAARVGDPTLLDEARALTSEVLQGGLLEHHQRCGFAGACYRLLDAGAWPDRAEGERILEGLDLLRPRGQTRPRT